MLGVVAFAALPAGAQPSMAIQPAAHVRSIEVVDEGTPVYVAARDGAARRGRLKRATRLSFTRRLAGPGCTTGYWYEVGSEAYVCERHVTPSPREPHGRPQPVLEPGALLPLDYAFVRADAARVYAHPRDYFTDDYIEALGDGFGLVITGFRDYDGVRFLRTRRGLWIDADSVGWARGSELEGVTLEEGQPLDHAWVLRNAPVTARARGRVVRRATRRSVVHVAEVEPHGVVRLTDGTYMRERDLARARLSPPPPEVTGDDETWVDVDVEQQVMVAYRGARPVYATLVSSGRERAGNETPLGVHRVWVKLAFSDMSNLSDEARSYYAIEQVPWVQYFQESNGFHAAFWHDDFGRRRSHGCVNLSPRDARWLFEFLGPPLPPGWDALFSTEAQPGAVVQVR